MGFCSWKTSEGASISNRYSVRGPLPVYMLLPDGRRVFEERYEGYGEFVDMDFFEMVAELNTGHRDREAGISLYFAEPAGDRLLPRFTTDPTKTWEELSDPEYCPCQGYFYIDDVEVVNA